MSEVLKRDKLQEFVQAFGKKKAVNVLSALGKGQGFIDAISSPCGIEILGEAQTEWANLLVKIASDKAEQEDKIKFKLLDQLLTLWAGKIAKHYQYEMEVQEKMAQTLVKR